MSIFFFFCKQVKLGNVWMCVKFKRYTLFPKSSKSCPLRSLVNNCLTESVELSWVLVQQFLNFQQTRAAVQLACPGLQAVVQNGWDSSVQTQGLILQTQAGAYV